MTMTRKLKFKLGTRVMVNIFGKKIGAGTIVKLDERGHIKPYLIEIDGMCGVQSWFGEEEIERTNK